MLNLKKFPAVAQVGFRPGSFAPLLGRAIASQLGHSNEEIFSPGDFYDEYDFD